MPTAGGTIMEKGDVVWLKSGGPAMTVSQQAESGKWECQWFLKQDFKEVKEDSFWAESLTAEGPLKQRPTTGEKAFITCHKGDVVRLKSGGPAMTVSQQEASGKWECQWFPESDKELKRGSFRPESLLEIGQSIKVENWQ
jgi:uncharacterized protein YodC (DUF2158 family)